MKQLKDTKQMIFDTAAELFAQKGYHAVSMADIADQVGIKKSSIYNHYPAKEVIMEELLDHYLERMERFYERMHEVGSNITEGKDLASLLEQLMFSYEPEETQLMFYLTRIVHHEQFSSFKAADALIGNGYRKYMEEHVHFFDQIADAGYLSGKDRNQMYGELFARMSLTFATQFLHPEIVPTIETQKELYQFVIQMVVANEKKTKEEI